MNSLWTWEALCFAVGLDPTEGPDVAGISIDSRTLKAGDLFVALHGDPGPRFFSSHRSDRDGHDGRQADRFVDSMQELHRFF